MAITRLMHMKEAPGCKYKHLENGIKYILDVRNDGAKTDFGKWVGGNCGLEHDEVLQSFLDTKKFWEKEKGRQGYHFVISFPPGEVDAQKCFDVVRDFCDEYLADEYDYVFAIHIDQDHVHGHIIFNSVNRYTGNKYHYKNGDWKKSIQPITDKVCKENGVAPLIIESPEIGDAYAKWIGNNPKNIRWNHIMRADIDYAIERAQSMEDFFDIMHRFNYQVHVKGESSDYKGSNYITFVFTDEKGIEHRHRSYALTSSKQDDYSFQAIAERVRNKNLSEPYCDKLSNVMEQKVNVRLGQTSTIVKGTKTYKRMYQAVSYYKLPNPFAVNQREVRRDMLRIERLIEDCAYIKAHPNVSIIQMEKRLVSINERLKELYILRKGLKEIEQSVRTEIPSGQVSRYRQLQKILSESREFDDWWEEAEDEKQELEKILPAAFVENEQKLRRCERNIEILKNEKKVMARVITTEGGKEKQLEKQVSVVKGL